MDQHQGGLTERSLPVVSEPFAGAAFITVILPLGTS